MLYVPLLVNMERGLKILSQYGGSFFQDRQQEIGDEMTVLEHYLRPKERLKEYWSYLKEMYVCAQKEYLHGVSLVKVSVKCVKCVSCVITVFILQKLISINMSWFRSVSIALIVLINYLTPPPGCHGDRPPDLDCCRQRHRSQKVTRLPPLIKPGSHDPM